MNYVREFVQDAAIGVSVVDRQADLDGFLAPGVAAAIWQRPLPSGFHAWISELTPLALPSCRIIVKPEAVRDAVTEVCEDAGTPAGIWRDWFIDDVVSMADMFAGLMTAEFLRVRLDVVTTDACRKFHIDQVTARLLCTYRGTGTQYGLYAEDAEPALVETAPTGAPILLRGTLWPDPPVSGLVHRSPPIAGSGETRLLLVLDPMERPQEHVALP